MSRPSSCRAALKGSAATCIALLALLPATALAQGAPQENVPSATGAAPTTAAASGATADEDTIIVTGSLIRNPNLVSSQPVTVTTQETIRLRAANVAEEVLRDIPGVVPSIGSAVNNGNAGASFVDLRGIGENRNLVLLDGQRIAPSGLEGVVDLNNIPLALIQRVDNLTGGAVTTYGADAISGVVNFITRQDFSGVEAQLSNGLTERGDGQYFRADLTLGANFEDGRGNATISLGYQKSDPVFQGNRDISIENIDSYSGAAGGSGTAVPSRFSGARPIDPLTGLPSTDPTVANGNLQLDPATGTARTLYAPFNFNPFSIFQTPFERFNIFAQARYEVSDNLEFYTRGLFSRNTVSTIVAPSGIFGSPVDIPLNNPFLPAGLRAQLCASNIGVPNDLTEADTYTPLFAPDQCAAGAAGRPALRNVLRTDAEGNPVFDTAGNPLFDQELVSSPTVTTNLARRTAELGPRVSDFRTTVFDYRAGVRGNITSTVRWDLSGSYGASENIQTISGYALTSRARQSLLATSPTTCADPSNGCVPINFFGPAGSITPEQAAFLTAASTSTVRTTLGQVRALISGDLGVSLGSASPIGFAIGGEYRNYTAQQAADLLAQTPGELGGFGGANPNIDGGTSVREVYGELIVPLLADRPFFENLTIEAGARYSQYKVDAPGNPSFDAFTWKAGGTWAIGGGLKVRGNYSRAVRAPNISELFTPNTVGLSNLGVDPCAGAAPQANAALRAVCLAQGAPATSIGRIETDPSNQVNAVFGGNTNLRPEIADTWTAGVVFQPAFIPGLAITADYYDIRVNQAITAALPGDVVGACFNNLTAASAASAACTGIRRDPATGALFGDPGIVPGLPLPTTNAGRIFTRGIDGTISYSTSLGPAKVSIIGNANYTLNSSFQASPTSLARECVGLYSANCSFTGSIQPKFQSSLRTTFGFDAFDISVLWRYIDPVRFEPRQFDEDLAGALASPDDCPDPRGADAGGCVVDPAFRRIRPFHFFDLSGRVSVTDNVTLIATVANLFDRQPPLVGTGVGSTAFGSGNTFPATYDALGRRYTVQAIVKF